jgi:serine/threonine protein kinase
MQGALGDYRILEPIAGSEAVEVFRARDTRSGRTVAIKVLTSPLMDDPLRRRQFLAEAQAASTLFHPNIATLYELGERDHQPYLVFEFVDGQMLSALIAGRPLNARRAIEFAIQVADALADAHASDLVHQAISPDTVVVTAKGHAKTLDFGMGAYLVAVATEATAYWAPEQRAGAPVDRRADIYALGVVLSEMLTGRLPRSEAPAGDLPREVIGIIQKMIANDRDRRFDSAATLAGELRQAAAAIDQRPAMVTALPPVPVPARQAAGVPAWILLIVGVVLAAALLWLAGRVW